MIQIISWAIFGLLAGVVAKLLMPGRDPGGYIVTVLLGIAGAMVGGFIGRSLGFGGATGGGGSFGGFVLAVVGAMLLLGLYRLVKGRTAPHMPSR